MCDQIAIIDHGKVMIEGTLEQLLATLESRFKLTFSFADETLSTQVEELFLDAKFGKVVRTDNTIEVLPQNNAQAIAESVNRLQSSSIAFDDLRVERGTLEEVFLIKTGKSLRD